MEVQRHGFTWQNEILEHIFKIPKEDLGKMNYTAEKDLPRSANKLGDFHVSIKVTGSANKVDMADCLRVFDSVHSNEPLHMIVVVYKQLGAVKKIVDIVEVDLTSASAELFGELTRAQIEELDRAVKAVPKGRALSAEERAHLDVLQKGLQAHSGAIQLNRKIDSKVQRRLQCSFNKFQQFLKDYPARIVERSGGGSGSSRATLRGGAIREDVESGPRVFNKKEGVAAAAVTDEGKHILSTMRLRQKESAPPK